MNTYYKYFKSYKTKLFQKKSRKINILFQLKFSEKWHTDISSIDIISSTVPYVMKSKVLYEKCMMWVFGTRFYVSSCTPYIFPILPFLTLCRTLYSKTLSERLCAESPNEKSAKELKIIP